MSMPSNFLRNQASPSSLTTFQHGTKVELHFTIKYVRNSILKHTEDYSFQTACVAFIGMVGRRKLTAY